MIRTLIVHGGIVFIIFVVIGKLDFSFFHNGTVLHQTTHDILFYKYEENQEGYIWTSGMSRRSHKVHISELGTRQQGQELTCDKFRVLATGSSSTFGSGLRDNETWSALANKKFQETEVPIEIFNAGNPGWGAYQWSHFISLYADQFNPDLVLIPISYGDFTFNPETTNEKERENWVKRDASKKAILNMDNFLSYALRKGMYLVQALQKKYQKSRTVGGIPLSDSTDKFDQHFERQSPYISALLELAKTKNFELIFFVRNADDTPVGRYLIRRLGELIESNDPVSISQISPADFMPGLEGDEVKKYYESNLIIKNDGHPNRKYSALMADKIFLILNEALKTMPEYKNACAE